MKVPVAWLEQYVDFDLSAEQVATKLTMGGLEVEGIEESVIGPVLDVYVTPNRGDCLSIVGVAREISALLATPLKSPESLNQVIEYSAASHVSVTIQDPDLCPRYAAQVVENIRVGPSPLWLQQRLEAAGQRAVNNIVDVTNYVMLELGQPLHAFDLDRLEGERIIVRQARSGEEIVTLDGDTRALSPPMLVIADAAKPVGVAGIMGGAESEVTSATKRILIEAAHFAPLSVRRTSRELALRTEASYRFERVVDPAGVVRAIQRCTSLLMEIGQPVPTTLGVDVHPNPVVPAAVILRVGRASMLLGMELTDQICVECLTALGFGVKALEGPGMLSVTIPPYRADVSIEEDLIEEVGRIYGYENIPETLPAGTTTRGGDSESGCFLSEVRRILVDCGLQEVVTHSLTAPSFFDSPGDASRRVAVRNALSANVGGLRTSLLPTLVDVAQHNASRGQQHLALFEIGRIWQSEPAENDDEPIAVEYLSVAGLLVGNPVTSGWRSGGKNTPKDYYAIKGVLDQLLRKLHISGHTLRPVSDRQDLMPQFHPGRSATISFGGGRPDGVIGELHPSVASQVDLRNRVLIFELSLESLQSAARRGVQKYKAVSRQQAISRDIAPRVLQSVPYAAVSAAISAANVEILDDFRLTDQYTGAPLPPAVKSLTVTLTFASRPSAWSEDRAISEEEVNEGLARIRTELETRCGATFAG